MKNNVFDICKRGDTVVCIKTIEITYYIVPPHKSVVFYKGREYQICTKFNGLQVIELESEIGHQPIRKSVFEKCFVLKNDFELTNYEEWDE